MDFLVVADPQITLVGSVSQVTIVENAPQVTVISEGIQGPPGTPGADGPIGPSGGSALPMTAGAILGGGRILTVDANGDAIYADASNPAHIRGVVGLGLNAAILGATVNVQIVGETSDVAWSWTVGQPIFLGLNGLMTQTVPTAPTAAFALVVAYPITPTKIVVGLREPITLL